MEKPKAIIYLRKSTDRDDRQQISIETQRLYCERLAKDYGFDTDTIEDHKSAKDEGKRPGFRKLLSLCKRGGYDYVIAYDPTRISRNTVDSAYFTELINKGHIKGFYSAESRQFFNGSDIFSALMLGISFLMSKADNQMRSSNTRKKMEMYFKEGRVMTNPPFGYKNYQFFDDFERLQHDVIVVEEEAKLVLEAFEMRKNGALLKDIADHFQKNGFEKKKSSAIDHILRNPFYIGIQKGKLGEAEIRMPGYRPLISCRLFEQVNSIRRELKRQMRTSYDAPLKGLVFSGKREPLIAYETRNRYGNPYIYYRANSRSLRRLNLSQGKLFERFDNFMEGFAFPDGYLEDMGKALKKAFRSGEDVASERRMIQDELLEIELSKKILTQKLIEGVVSDEDYKELSVSYFKRKKLLEERLSGLSDETRNINTHIVKWVELLGKLLWAYKNKSLRQKAQVLKIIQVELFVGGDSSLTVEENELLKCAKNLGLHYGRPKNTSVEHFQPIIRCIEENFSEVYEYVEDAYEALFEQVADDDESEAL